MSSTSDDWVGQVSGRRGRSSCRQQYRSAIRKIPPVYWSSLRVPTTGIPRMVDHRHVVRAKRAVRYLEHPEVARLLGTRAQDLEMLRVMAIDFGLRLSSGSHIRPAATRSTNRLALEITLASAIVSISPRDLKNERVD